MAKRKHPGEEPTDDKAEEATAHETPSVGSTHEADSDRRAVKARFEKKYKTTERSNEEVLGA